MDDSELAQQALGSLEVPLSLRLTISRPTEFDVGKGGLEGHAEPSGGRQAACQAAVPGPAAREVVEATAPQAGARLPDREDAREGAKALNRPAGRLAWSDGDRSPASHGQVDLGNPGIALEQENDVGRSNWAIRRAAEAAAARAAVSSPRRRRTTASSPEARTCSAWSGCSVSNVSAVSRSLAARRLGRRAARTRPSRRTPRPDAARSRHRRRVHRACRRGPGGSNWPR